MRLVATLAAAVVAIATAGASSGRRDVPVFLPSRPSFVGDDGWVDFRATGAVTRGVAATCFSFTNRDPRTLDRLVVRFDFLDADRHVLHSETRNRRGVFSTDVEIAGYTGSGAGTREFEDGGQCVVLRGRALPFAPDAVARISLIPTLYHYTDGTTITPFPPFAP